MLLAAACGGDDGDDAEPVAGDDGDDMAEDDGDDGDDGDEPEPEPEPRTASWRGVTEDTVTVGVSMLNFDLLKELNLSPAGWGDQQGITHDSFRAAAESLSDFVLPGAAASLSSTKLGASDLSRLAAYDHTEGDGGVVPVTGLIDAFP